MSAPVYRDDNPDDAKLYAPPWARERPLPAAGQPQYTSSPPVASAREPIEDAAAPKEPPPRMPRGVGGPNISSAAQGKPAGTAPGAASGAASGASWAPKLPPRDAFTGDVAMQALRRRLTLEPEAVPQPPLVMRRETPFSWIGRLALICLAAGVGAFGITALSVTDFYPPVANKGDAGFTPQSSDSFNVAPARLVVESSRASANDPLPLGVSLKDSAGGESVFLSGLENGTRLTAGTPLGSKGWRITARDLGSVLAYAPVNYIGAMHAAINLHAANDAVVDTRVVKLEWIRKPEQAATQPAPEPAAAAVVVAAPSRPQLDQDEIGLLIKRGQQLLQAGDIAPARLLLQRAAVGGSAQAALVLGGTYDPDVLREAGVLGFAADPGKAREWYQKALELGASEATRRLDRLAQARR